MVGEPIAGEEVLHDNHAQSHHHGVGNAQFVIASQTVAAEYETADDGLQQIVRETHAAKDAQMMEYTAHALEGIPCRDHSRDNHQEDDEIVDWLEPAFQTTKVDEAQDNDKRGGDTEDSMPNLQIPPLVVEQSLSP